MNFPGAFRRHACIDAVFLAAGASTRFGCDKRFVLIDGEPMAVRSLRPLLASRLRRIVVVIDTDSAKLRELLENALAQPRHSGNGSTSSLLDGRSLGHRSNRGVVVENAAAESGLMSSVKTGLRALISTPPGTPDAVMVALADEPGLSSGTVDALLDAFAPDRFVVPVRGGRRHHPRVIPRSAFHAFLALGDAESGEIILRARADRVDEIETGSDGEFADVDWPEDLPGTGTGDLRPMRDDS